ncbi:hypothetical protein TY91_05145 [Secundilactobacillus collinoides]|uniref:Uncharacterized protein n=1 Tax=Secundilactobacillus collinoides TaxID=33960 RepID=A0A166HB44_SECCO|nr:hypothetical protein TY91_05145 [Secundilactobacillus collinoides]
MILIAGWFVSTTLDNMHDSGITLRHNKRILMLFDDSAILEIKVHYFHDQPIREDALNPPNKPGVHLIMILALN